MKRAFLILFLVAIASCRAVYAQQNALILPWITQHFTNTNGTPLANGKVCTYQAGTSTGLATYTDSTASVANNVPPNAILLDSTGRAPGIWLKVGLAYKIVVLTAGSDSTCNTGVTVKTQDNVVGQAGASLTANNAFTGNSSHSGAETFKNINLIRTAYVGGAFDVAGGCAGEMGCIINNAIKDTPDGASNGILVYAFGGGTISTNSWASIGNRSGVVSFGPQIWTTNISLVLPKAWRVEGFGRGGVADGKNTIAKAGTSFPTSTPMFQMGTTPVDNGVQIRSLGIDCQNVSGVSGIQNQFSQEQGIVEHVLFVNCPGGALSVSGSAQNSGPYSDLEVLNFSCSNCSAATVPISIGNVSSFRGIRGATINSNGSTLPTVAFRIDTGGSYTDIHIESAVSSVIIGSQNATSAVFMSNIECGPSITDCVKISNAFANQNISLFGINATTGNIITDQRLSNTLTSAGEGGQVSMYVLGNGGTPTLLTSSTTTLNIFGDRVLFHETAVSNGVGAYEACYGDSTAHAIRCSYNNSAFGPLVTAAPCTTSQKTESAADANVLTCAIPAQAGSYRLRFVLSVSAANAATLGWTAAWTDSNGNAQTPANIPISGAGTNGSSAPALTLTLGNQNTLYGYADVDVNNSGTSIVVKLTFSGTSFTGKASATVERII